MDASDMNASIVVVGYPRSGNTWVSRALGDILQSPVGGGYGAKPLCTEGQERPGKYHVQQLHLKPDYSKHMENGAYQISVPAYKGKPRLVLVVRDPRDIVVSVMHYWNLEGVDRALDALINGHHPLGVHGPWSQHVEDWLDSGLPYILVRYDDLHTIPYATWLRVMNELTELYEVNGEKFRYTKDRVSGAIDRQEFKAKKAQIAIDGDGRPYGKTIQQKHLRKGIVGDWESHFNVEQEELAREHFGRVAQRLGYAL